MNRTATWIFVFLTGLGLLGFQGCGDSEHGAGEFKGERFLSDSGRSYQQGIGDQELCALLVETAVMAKGFGSEYDFLCLKKGLEQVREKGLVYLTDEVNNKISTLASTGYFQVKAKMQSAKNWYKLFCDDFSKFTEIAPEAFEQINDIESSNITEEGCNFHFIGEKVLFYKPEFKGRAHYVSELAPGVFLFAYYLTEQISMIQKYRNLVIVIENGENLDMYVAGYVKVDSKGFHNKVKEEMEGSAKLLKEGIAENLDEY